MSGKENKTQKTDQDVSEFIGNVAHPTRQADARELLDLLTDITEESPVMWGPSIVGFGDQHYEYASGRTGDWFLIGFSPRKQSLTIYLTDGIETHATLLRKLGKHKTSVGCLYLNKLADVDPDVLRQLLTESVAGARAQVTQD